MSNNSKGAMRAVIALVCAASLALTAFLAIPNLARVFAQEKITPLSTPVIYDTVTVTFLKQLVVNVDHENNDVLGGDGIMPGMFLFDLYWYYDSAEGATNTIVSTSGTRAGGEVSFKIDRPGEYTIIERPIWNYTQKSYINGLNFEAVDIDGVLSVEWDLEDGYSDDGTPIVVNFLSEQDNSDGGGTWRYPEVKFRKAALDPYVENIFANYTYASAGQFTFDLYMRLLPYTPPDAYAYLGEYKTDANGYVSVSDLPDVFVNPKIHHKL